jgi:outer membrane protein assembly factor BamB
VIRYAAAALVALLVLAAHAAAAVRVAPGWPRAAPSGTVLQGPDGGVVVVSFEALHSEVRAYRRDGHLWWRNDGRFGCGNCDDGPQPEALQPDGTYGPIGVEGDDFWAVDARGRRVDGCAGVVGADGSCVTGLSVVRPGAFDRLPGLLGREADGTTWRVADDRFRWTDDFDVPAMTVADGGGLVYAAFDLPVEAGTGTRQPGLLMAVDRVTRAIRWTRVGPAEVLAALAPGVLVREGAGVTVYAPDGSVQWSRPVPTAQSVSPRHTGVDAVRGQVYLGRRGGGAPGVTALDIATGAQVWTTRPSDRARLLSVGRGGRVYVAIDAAARRAVRALRFRTGATAWERRTRLPVRGARELAGGRVAVSAGNEFAPMRSDRLTVLVPG